MEKEKKLKQRCEDCDVPLVHLISMDKPFRRYIKNSSLLFSKKRFDELMKHKTIYCPNCKFVYDNNFKKMEIKIGILRGRQKK